MKIEGRSTSSNVRSTLFPRKSSPAPRDVPDQAPGRRTNSGNQAAKSRSAGNRPLNSELISEQHTSRRPRAEVLTIGVSCRRAPV